MDLYVGREAPTQSPCWWICILRAKLIYTHASIYLSMDMYGSIYGSLYTNIDRGTCSIPLLKDLYFEGKDRLYLSIDLYIYMDISGSIYGCVWIYLEREAPARSPCWRIWTLRAKIVNIYLSIYLYIDLYRYTERKRRLLDPLDKGFVFWGRTSCISIHRFIYIYI